MKPIDYTPAGNFVSAEDMEKLLKSSLWPEKMYRKFFRVCMKIKGVPEEIKYFIQRGRRGWAECDVWSLDFYLAKVISQSVRSLQKFPNSVPSVFKKELGCGDEEAEKKWGEVLGKISNGFAAMCDIDDRAYVVAGKSFSVQETERKNTAKEGMELFVKHFENLWD